MRFKTYLLGDVDESREGKLRKGVQCNDHHGCGGVGGHEFLQQLPAPGGQSSIVVHVLQHRDQFQLQFHWSGQT